MNENYNKIEGKIQYDDYEKNLSFPDNYDILIEEILSLFNIPEEKKPFLIITYKNTSGDSLKITNQEEYLDFLTKIKEKELNNIISVSIQKIIKNKIQPFIEEVYDKDDKDIEEDEDKDELLLRQGHVFLKNKNAQSEIYGDKMELAESIEGNINNENNKFDIDNIFNNEVVKSVLPPMTSFPSYCNSCQKFPIVKIMYYCDKCQLYLCEDCEKNLGYNHRHCYYKIRNKEQYQEILKFENQKLYIKVKNENDNNKKSRMAQLKEKKEGFDGIFNSIFEFMTGTKDNTGSK
jgi:transposase-like protein